MAAAFIVGASGNAGGVGNVATTGAANITGADLLVVEVHWFTVSGTPAITDSLGTLTWEQGTPKSTGVNSSSCLWRAKNVSGGGAGFTVTATLTSGFHSIAMAAFSGSNTTEPYDQHNEGATASGATVQPGAITPSEAGAICVCGFGGSGASSPYSIDDDFTIAAQNSGGGSNFSCGIAYLIQTTAEEENPTVTLAIDLQQAAAVIASFKAAAVAGGNRRRRVLLTGGRA